MMEPIDTHQDKPAPRRLLTRWYVVTMVLIALVLTLGYFGLRARGFIPSKTVVEYPPSAGSNVSPDRSTALANRWQPTLGFSFQWQLTALPVDTSVEAAVYEIDGLDNPRSVVDQLHAKGRQVICYIDVGSWEDYREDKDQFPNAVIGKEYQGYPDERWLDIRQIEILAPVLEKRLDTCRDKGFDAVEADNVDGFEQDTGFPLTAADQLKFNRWVASEIQARGMAAALKNDGTQAAELVDAFDFVVTEECVVLEICDEYAPFRAAGKLHLNVEYTDTPIDRDTMCTEARRTGMTAVLKHRSLDAYLESC